MTDYYLGVVPQSVEWELRANVRRFASPDGGVTRTHERVGSRWAARFRWDVVGGANAARLRAFLASQRGGANRFWTKDPGYTRRGSYPASENFANNDFSNGTTSWIGQNSALTAADGVLRITPTATGASNPGAYQVSSVTQYQPTALRAVHMVAPTFAYTSSPYLSDGVSVATQDIAGGGLRTAVLVPRATGTTGNYPGYISSVSGYTTSDYLDIPYSSLARCALVDNGPNSMIYSDDLDNASWTKANASVTANAYTAPDGTATGDALVEDGTLSEHYAQQITTRASGVADVCGYAYLRRAVGTRDVQMLVGNSGVDYVYANFNLASGTVTSPTAAGAASNARAFIQAAGGGWYRCAVVGTMPTATAIRQHLYLSDGSTTTYTGDGTSAVAMWRVGAAVSGVPTRGQFNLAITDDDGNVQTGASLHLKGLPVSTSGLLLPGDWVEIVTPTYSEFKRVTHSLDSDGLGLGLLQFEPLLRQSPTDNAPVIVHDPLCRMMLDEGSVRMTHLPGGRMSVEFTAVEDVAA